MDIETVREYCLRKKGVEESMPFDDTSLVMKVMGKMFILISLEGDNRIALKCDPDRALELRDQYRSIEPAYHFNKKHWNQVGLDGDADEHLVRELIDHSYDLVVQKFTRKMKQAYDLLP